MNTQAVEIEMKVPHSIELEQAVLGSILIRQESLDVVVENLKPEHFYDPLHGRIYEACVALVDSNRVISPANLGPYFENEMVGPLTVKQYLGRLVGEGNPPSIEDYAKTIRDLFISRSGIIISEDLSRALHEPKPGRTVSQEIETALDSLFQITNQSDARKSVNAGIVAQEVISDLTNQSETKFIPTGLHGLNRVIGGYFPGDCIYIGGRPSMGKSAFAQSEALKAAKAGYGVALFSLEMSAKEITHRMLSDLVYTENGEIPYAQIRQGNVAGYQRDRLADAANRLESFSLDIYDRRGISISDIRAQMRQISRKFQKRGKRLDILFVDYLGKIRTSDRYKGNKAYELGEVSNALTILADEFQIPIVILHQLNRDVETREDKTPTMSDFKSSGDIEQDAHVILFPFRPVYYLQRDLDAGRGNPDELLTAIEQSKNEMHIIVAKQRNGPSSVVKARTSMGSNAIRNII